MIRLMLLSHGLVKTDRAHLERLGANLAMVAIRFQAGMLDGNSGEW